MEDVKEKLNSALQLYNHAADPVGIIVGRNPETGGAIPEGSTTFREKFRAAAGQPVTTHNCYRSVDPACAGFWSDKPALPTTQTTSVK